jgi:dipeptidyl aminopeptidase/acylaminoacyl peptidase
MEHQVTFESDGLVLTGVVHTPDDMEPGERRPAIMVLHGFGSNKSSGNSITPAEMLCDWGYVTMRFDFRGCGESEGEYGRIICLEQVADTSNALSYLQTRDDVDPDRIGAVGSSFGAAVAVYTGGVDTRLAAVISSGGWGDGERKFRNQHPGAEAWAKFTGILEQGRKMKEETGETLMVSRWDIVPIPEHLRGNLAKGSHMEFPVDTAQSMYDFVADDVVAAIAPRPLLLLHSSVDTVTPTEQSVEMFKRAGQPCDLHLFAETHHFMFGVENTRVITVLRNWLDTYFPVKATVAA